MSTYSTRIGRLLGLDNDWSMVITVRLVYQINRSGPCSSNNGNDAPISYGGGLSGPPSRTQKLSLK
jgi:hypothetical protein